MKVVAVGWTSVSPIGLRESGYVAHPYHPAEIDELHEAAGRGCYQSWHRPNPATATNAGYLSHIIEIEHESVMEHGTVTLYVSGVSRALLLELERHRHLSFSVLSQRYVDQNRVGVVVPPLFTVGQAERLRQHHEHCLEMYDQTYHELIESGATVKEARGAARAFLPEATETRFVVTGNIRAWKNVLRQRLSPAADAEIQEFAEAVLLELEKVAPNSVMDLTREVTGATS